MSLRSREEEQRAGWQGEEGKGEEGRGGRGRERKGRGGRRGAKGRVDEAHKVVGECQGITMMLSEGREESEGTEETRR